MQRDENVSDADPRDDRTVAVEPKPIPAISAAATHPRQGSSRGVAPVRWTVVLPIACLAITLGFWWDTSTRLRDVSDRQERLARDVAALRQMPVIDVTGAPALGSEDVVVTLIEFSDYECPFCIRHYKETMPQIAREFIDRGQLRYVFRDFPIVSIHPDSPRAHEAARCANDQGKFWQMHSRLFSAPGTHSVDALTRQAVAAGLDLQQFEACLSSGRHADEVKASVAEITELGANGTPVFFVGIRDRRTNHVDVQRAITGAQPFEAFKEAIEDVLKRVSASS
jgi:protein-disulfide isomerase